MRDSCRPRTLAARVELGIRQDVLCRQGPRSLVQSHYLSLQTTPPPPVTAVKGAMTLTRQTDGREIISENESYWTNEYGTLMRRIEQVLDDGTEIIQDLPVQESTATGYHHPQPSAPMEDDSTIPIVHVTAVPAAYDTNDVPHQPYPINVPCSPVAVVTGPPQPPRVAVVTGPPRPPPHVYYPSSRYVYRDERTGVCMICGLSALICLSICCCCLLPVVIIPIIVVPIFKDATDDDFYGAWQDDNI